MTVSRSRRGGKALMVLSVDSHAAGRSRRAHAGRGLRRRARPRARPRRASPVPGWPEPVERVAAVLRERGADVRLEEFSRGTPTAEAAADAVGCETSQIVKSLVFICDGLPVLALVPGDRRADAAKIAAAVGAGYARMARPDEVVAATGFEPGAVAPFPAPNVSRRAPRPGAPAPRDRLDRRRLEQAHGRARADGPDAPRRGHARRSGGSRRVPFSEPVRRPRRRDAGDKKIWMNGELVDWADATIHVGTHALHYGSGVFEGIRAYETDEGHRRLPSHRAHAAAARLGEAPLPGASVLGRRAEGGDLGPHRRQRAARPATSGRSRSAATASSASRRATTRSTSRSCRGRGARTSARRGCANGIRVEGVELAARRPERHPARREGDRRLHQLDARGRRGATAPATRRRSSSPHDGYIADGSGESIFIVRDGVIYTPDLSASILVGITRDTVIQIAQDLGHRVVEKPLIRTDLYLADEVFMVRHRRRGDADPRGRRPRHRPARPDHARDPVGVPRHRARPQRSLVAVARVRAARRSPRREAGGAAPSRSRGRISTSGRRSSCSRSCAPAGSRSGRRSTASRRRFAAKVGAPYAAAVSSGTAGLHLLCASARASAPATR